mmetsp:Transcript_38711/g.115668  ORF Transcript_38711/g.115668 Transcript_38711/m.115668 type:complete len:378 (-) Transcript_38711:680-1813(-)
MQRAVPSNSGRRGRGSSSPSSGTASVQHSPSALGPPQQIGESAGAGLRLALGLDGHGGEGLQVPLRQLPVEVLDDVLVGLEHLLRLGKLLPELLHVALEPLLALLGSGQLALPLLEDVLAHLSGLLQLEHGLLLLHQSRGLEAQLRLCLLRARVQTLDDLVALGDLLSGERKLLLERVRLLPDGGQHVLEPSSLRAGLLELSRLVRHQLLLDGQLVFHRGHLDLELANFTLVLELEKLKLLDLLAQHQGLSPCLCQLGLSRVEALLTALARGRQCLALLLQLLARALCTKGAAEGLVQGPPELGLRARASLGHAPLQLRECLGVLLPKLGNLPSVFGLERAFKVLPLLRHDVRAHAELVGLAASAVEGLLAASKTLG